MIPPCGGFKSSALRIIFIHIRQQSDWNLKHLPIWLILIGRTFRAKEPIIFSHFRVQWVDRPIWFSTAPQVLLLPADVERLRIQSATTKTRLKLKRATQEVNLQLSCWWLAEALSICAVWTSSQANRVIRTSSDPRGPEELLTLRSALWPNGVTSAGGQRRGQLRFLLRMTHSHEASYQRDRKSHPPAPHLKAQT